jgi:hypothetical protein
MSLFSQPPQKPLPKCFYDAVEVLESLGLEHGDFSIYLIPDHEGSLGHGLFTSNQEGDPEENFCFELHDPTIANKTSPVLFLPDQIDLFRQIATMLIEANKWSIE